MSKITMVVSQLLSAHMTQIFKPAPDCCFVIWDPRLTGNFTNAPYSPPPENFKRDNFQQDIVRLRDFLGRTEEPDFQVQFQQALLTGLKDTKLGLYSIWHDLAVFERGLDHHKTMFLAQMYV